ncbi:MAG: type 1 glutamine amidotransferase [Verrucomicrobia bacterium]|nr:type 1 glutamine amidotransferase [Verrucomicrobiota bacterium]
MKKIVIFVEDIYEDIELWYPKIRLEEAGMQVAIAGPVAGQTYKGKHGYPCRADISFKEALERKWDGAIIPGGFAPDRIRRSLEVLKIIQTLHESKKLVAFICHGGWVAISAKILKGKKTTGTIAIKDDLENAGAIWANEPAVVDGHLVSSRTPVDLAEFLKAILKVV